MAPFVIKIDESLCFSRAGFMEPSRTFRRGERRTKMKVSGDGKALRRTCEWQLRLRRQGGSR